MFNTSFLYFMADYATIDKINIKQPIAMVVMAFLRAFW